MDRRKEVLVMWKTEQTQDAMGWPTSLVHLLPPNWPLDVPLARITTCGCSPLSIEVLQGFQNPLDDSGESPCPIYGPLTAQQWNANGGKTALILLEILTSQPGLVASQDLLAQALRPARRSAGAFDEEADEDDGSEDRALKRPENVVTLLRRLLYPPALAHLPQADQRAIRNALIMRIKASTDSGPAYRLAGFPLLWIDVEAMEAHYQRIPILTQFGEDVQDAWQSIGELGLRGTFLPHERYSDWVQWRRSRVRDLLWQSVDAQMKAMSQWEDRETADEVSIRLLFQFWHGQKNNEDAFRLLTELLSRRERFEQAEECYLELCAALECEGRLPHERTEKVMAFVRAKQVQRKLMTATPEGPNVDRRQAIKTISTASASIALAQQELDREIDRLIVRKLARLHNWVVDGLEDGTRLRWQLYYTSRNSLTEDGLLSQIARLEQLADDGGDHYQRVCRILAQNYQLAGSLSRDRFQYTKSIDYFQKAEQLHRDTQLSDLTAASIARQGVALLRKDPEKYLKEAVVLYSRAVDSAKHAEPYTQAYVLCRYAEALARKGSYDECFRSLDQAEVLLSHAADVPIEEDFAYVRLTY
jgi:hypothetical protein